MIKIKIAEEERMLGEVDEHWINQQINKRRADGQTVCVWVTIQGGDLDMVLSTPTCGSSLHGGRLARPQEMKVFELWDQRGLNKQDFTGGNLVAFLRQLERLI